MNLKLAICAILGHSNIETMFFGYHNCARCDTQVGDSLGGCYVNDRVVIVGHNCCTCTANYYKLSWKDKFMVRNPFKKEI